MDDKRETLSKMLMQLMDQKSERSQELQSRLQEMESTRSEEQDNYWLIQYQKLLDSKPKVSRHTLRRALLNAFERQQLIKNVCFQGLVEAEKTIDGKVKEILTSAGADEYIPVFALREITVKQLALMKDKELSEVAILDEMYVILYANSTVLFSWACTTPT